MVLRKRLGGMEEEDRAIQSKAMNDVDAERDRATSASVRQEEEKKDRDGGKAATPKEEKWSGRRTSVLTYTHWSYTQTSHTPHVTSSTPVLPCTHDSTETTTLFLLQPSTQSDRSALTLSAAPLRRGHAAKSKGLTRLAGVMLLAYRDLLCDRVEFGIVSGGSLESPVNKGWLIESESSSPACFSPFASLSAHPPLPP